MKNITLSDVTLRDGNHCVKHSINLNSIETYCKFVESANIPIVEVGHGNGLGASSLLIGESTQTDSEIIECSRKFLNNSKLSVHAIPGIATIKKDIDPAIKMGVDIFRIASHVTEANITKTHIEYIKNKNKVVYGVLMMSALADTQTIVDESKKMQEYGADAIILMDSTGTYLPEDVRERILALKENLNIQIGFHAHNNLGLAVANSIIAIQNGSDIIDVCIRVFGAGAGNTPLEIMIPILDKYNYTSNINFQHVISEADNVMRYFIKEAPMISPINVLTGLYKLFSGFEKPIVNASKLCGIEYSSLIFEMGNKKLVAGQEDIILEIAHKLKNNKV